MDEYNSGMDPDLKRYFQKIMSSFSLGLLWMLTLSTTGIFFGLAEIHEGIRWYNVFFYLFALSTLILLLRYYYRNWKD
jgi:hypothetical protein